MSGANKRLLRAVIRRVHPDLFNSLPFERSHNSDNLKLLNQYVDKLATGANPPAISVSFWTRGDLQLELTDAVLDGSLGNLYLAFGLISEEEWAELRARNPTGVTGDDINLLQWLDETVRDAVATADEHEQRKKLVRELKATIEFRFGLAAVRVGKTYSSSSVDLARQLECLRVFEAFLTEQTSTEMFEGLAFELYHPWSAPSQTYQWTDGTAAKRMEAAVMKAHISSDGSMHLIADRSTIRGQIESLDRKHAKVLSSVNDFWLRRQRDLVPQLRRILGVQNVWCDNRSAESQEAFVLWAGRVLNAKAAFEEALERRSYSFSVLVHSDPASPLVDYVTTSSILQVRSDCAPQTLQEFLTSDTADEADSTSLSLYSQEDEEAALLAEVKEVFGAKHVIRVCSSEDKEQAFQAARKLIAEADRIKTQVDLRGASIAIDDCYQVWDSGFISIPHSFDVADLRPRLAMLMSGDHKVGSAETEPHHSNGAADPRGLWDGRLCDSSPPLGASVRERPASSASDAAFLDFGLHMDHSEERLGRGAASVNSRTEDDDSERASEVYADPLWTHTTQAAGGGLRRKVLEHQEVLSGGVSWASEKGAGVYASDRLTSARALQSAATVFSLNGSQLPFRHKLQACRQRQQQHALAGHGTRRQTLRR